VTAHTFIVVCIPLLPLLGFAAGRSSVQPMPRNGRRRPDGGSSKPPASPTPKAGTTLGLSGTATTDYSSSPLPLGLRSVAWEAPRLLRDPSRLTGRGWSIAGTEALGANGVQRDYAAWDRSWPWRHWRKEARRLGTSTETIRELGHPPRDLTGIQQVYARCRAIGAQRQDAA